MPISTSAIDNLNNKIRANRAKIEHEEAWCRKTGAEVDWKKKQIEEQEAEIEKTKRLIQTLAKECEQMEKEIESIKQKLQEAISKR